MAQSTQTVRVTPPQAQISPPPISSILPLLSSASSTSLSVLQYVVWFINILFFSLLYYPFLAIIPIPIYLLSPLIITSKILLDLFVLLPYRALVYVSQALYPIYAFLGVACLSGVIVGFGGRQLVSLIGWGILGDEYMQSTTGGAGTGRRSRSPSHMRLQHQKRPSASARGKRKVTVRTED